MVPLLCTVRGCRAPLERSGKTVRCPRGHSFDIAASGYINLLQPQDRRSRHPGDSREAALARRRSAEAGHENPIVEALLAEIDRASPEKTPSLLDIGCGEGFVLRSLTSARSLDAHGLDISVPAIELAAKRSRDVTWIVSNADRFLPFAQAALDFVLSVTSRRNAAEIRRVLAPSGRAVVIVPAEDDAIELREAVLGRAVRRDRAEAAMAALEPELELLSRRTVRRLVSLDENGIRDLFAATYRGARFRERERIGALSRMNVTLAHDILVFRRH